MSSHLRILVVEDMPDAADSLALLLELWGYQSTVAYDGEHALRLASTFNPHVVFLDIGLPDMDGFEVAQQLRRLPGLTKALLVAITRYGMAEDVRRCQEVGFGRFFLKPVEPDQLHQVLAEAQSLGQDQRQQAC